MRRCGNLTSGWRRNSWNFGRRSQTARRMSRRSGTFYPARVRHSMDFPSCPLEAFLCFVTPSPSPTRIVLQPCQRVLWLPPRPRSLLPATSLQILQISISGHCCWTAHRLDRQPSRFRAHHALSALFRQRVRRSDMFSFAHSAITRHSIRTLVAQCV